MRILSIDPSTTTVGWALFSGESEADFVDCGEYKPTGRDAWGRVLDYGQWLCDAIQGWDPAMVCYELATGNRGNMRTNRLMGGLEAMTRWMVQDGPELVTVVASQVRASGCHKKALWAATAITKRPMTGDMADAIGVALAAFKKLQKQRRILAQIVEDNGG